MKYSQGISSLPKPLEEASWRKSADLDVFKLSWRKSVHLDVSNIFISKVVHVKEFSPAKDHLNLFHLEPLLYICPDLSVYCVSPYLIRFLDGWKGWWKGRNGKTKELTLTLKSPRLTKKTIKMYFLNISPTGYFGLMLSTSNKLLECGCNDPPSRSLVWFQPDWIQEEGE